MKFVAAVLISLMLFACDRDNSATSNPSEKNEQSAAHEPPVSIEFKLLSNFELPIADPVMAGQDDLKFIREALPKQVIDLNNKKVKIKGFMLPLVFTKEEKIITFLLTPNQAACCFGKVPALNEVIFCDSSKAYPDLRDTLLEITGIITTEPTFNEKDMAVYLYKLNIESIKELKAMPPPGPGLSF